MAISPPTTFSLEHVLHAEHARLVRLCAHLTGDRDAADDLAQETLIEAWRQRHKLTDPNGASAWLSAIARNVCLRWARSRGRELARTAPFDGEVHQTSDAFDLDVELERDELATLLDRALALLPPDTRDVLVQTYIHESPHAEIAERLGLSANAVAVRVHRGKLLLRRVLVNEFHDDAAAYGLVGPQSSGWQETRIWCPRCGTRRLSGHFDHTGGVFALRCFSCLPGLDVEICNVRAGTVLQGVTGFKAAWSRLITWASPFLRQALVEYAICPICKQSTTAQPTDIEVPPFGRVYGLHVQCGCDAGAFNSIHSLALDQPTVRRFRREHPRTVVLPTHMLHVGGREALLTRFESITGPASLDLIFARDTFALLAVHGGRDG